MFQVFPYVQVSCDHVSDVVTTEIVLDVVSRVVFCTLDCLYTARLQVSRNTHKS
jgi:hypothetical protein